MLDLSNIWLEWKAVELIGEGSFGKVYKCVREDEFGVKSESAIKVISIPTSRAEYDSVKMECASDEEVYSYFNEVVLDFTNEIKLMLKLKGAPNIVSVENYKIVERKDELGWDIYILMEYLTSFAKYSINKTFTEKEVKKFALDVLGALEVCEKNNIIHRDIKPANIFVDRYGSYKLGDFGVARQLEGSVSMMSKKGTAKYMAPEVYRSEKYDRRVDFYSLGLVMYKLLNRNRDPFIDINKEFVTFKERSESLEKMRRGDKIPAPVDASADMAAVILKACEYRPEDRFADVEQFRKALNNTLINDDLTVKEETKTEEKTIVAVIGDTTASMNGNDVTLGADEPTMLDEPTVMADEPTVMADEPTVLADEPTMLADDEATVVAPENEPTMLDEPTVLADDEPTVVADEPTVVDENKTVAADIAKSEAAENKPETEEKKTIESKKSFSKKHISVIAAVICVVLVASALMIGLLAGKGDDSKKIVDSLTDGMVSNINTVTVENDENQAPLNEEETYNLYLSGSDADTLRTKTVDYGDEITDYPWTGAEDIYYIDIDNDGVKECFYCTEFVDYRPIYQVTLLDIKDGKVELIKTFEDIVPYRWYESFVLANNDDGYLISVIMAGGSSGSSSATFKYNGNELVFYYSTVSNSIQSENADSYEDCYYFSTTKNLHEEYRYGEATLADEFYPINSSYLVSETEYIKFYDKIFAGEVVFSFGNADYSDGNLNCDAATRNILINSFSTSQYGYVTESHYCQYIVRDFDQDGNYEMFVLAASYENAEDNYLYFVTDNSIEIATENFSAEYFQSYCMGNRWFVRLTDLYSEMLFTVIEGKAVEYNIYSENNGSGAYFEMIAYNQCSLSFADFDYSVDGVGRTYEKHYFYWDENNLSFKEFGAIEISRDELLRCNGTANVLEMIENNGFLVKEILYRGNGVIDINCSNGEINSCVSLLVSSDGNVVYEDNSYLDSTVLYVENGLCQKAICPELAVYPEEFPY